MCVFPFGRRVSLKNALPDAADCAQAKEQPSTQNLILQGGSITVSLPESLLLRSNCPVYQFYQYAPVEYHAHILYTRDISYSLDIYLLKKKRSLLDLRFTSDPVTLMMCPSLL